MADSLAPGAAAPVRPFILLSPAPSLDGRAFSPLTPDVCFSPGWLPVDSWGYRTAINGKGGKSKAHRLAYRLFVGVIPAGALVLHRCGHAGCINPFHLYIGTALQNALDRRLHGTHCRGKDLPQTKLSDADVLAILASSERVTDLAREYRVSKSCISRIRTGHARAYVPQAASVPQQASAAVTTSGRA